MADQNNKLPDISGIFNIDDSRVPSKIIEKRPEDAARKPAGEPVMLRGPVTREEKKAEKLERESRKLQKKAAAKKRRRGRLILALVGLVAVLGLVLAVKTLIDNAKRPTVTLTAAATATVARHYDAKATMVNDPLGAGEDRLYAVFVENDFDVYGIEKNMKTKITNTEGRTVTGIVTEIRKEETDSTLIEKIMQLLTDSVVATNANYTVIVLPDDPTAVTDGETVEVQVITQEEKDALTVPSEAVCNDNGQAYVWKYKSFGKKLYRQDVTTGLASDGKVQITKGLSAGDLVASAWTCDATDLHDGVKVKVSQPAEQ